MHFNVKRVKLNKKKHFRVERAEHDNENEKSFFYCVLYCGQFSHSLSRLQFAEKEKKNSRSHFYQDAWNNNWSSKNKYQTNEHENNNNKMGAKSSFTKNIGKVHAQISGSFKYLRKPKTIAAWRGAGTLQSHSHCLNSELNISNKEHFFDIYNSILMIQITWMMKRFHTFYFWYTPIPFWFGIMKTRAPENIDAILFVANDRIFRFYFAGKDLNRHFFEFSKEISVEMKLLSND